MNTNVQCRPRDRNRSRVGCPRSRSPHQRHGEVREAIEDTLNALDSGALRVAQKMDDGSWHVNQWAKKAVLLSRSV